SKQKFKTNLYTAGGEVARGHIVEAGTLSTVFEFLSDPLLLQSMASVGDFNMDGVNDLAVGNIFDDDGGFRRGAVWIFFLNRDMEIIGRKKISNLKGNFKGELNNFDQFGFSITSIGDHNGDGVPDLAVGSFNMVSNRGSLWILFMNSDGTVKSHYQHTDLGTRGARLGQAMASVGDLDGDGVQEIAIGDPVVNGNTGAVYVLFLNADGSIKKSTTIANGIGLTRGKSFGETISPAGDVNQDGTPDLFVSASDSPSYLQSAIWVVFLNNNGESIGAHAITLKNGKFNEPEKLSFFGLGFCSPQDINFDNIPDLLVNTVNEGNLPPHIYALTLNGDGSVKENKLIFSGSRGDEESGFLMTFIGDNDDNGYPEVAFLSGPPWIPDAGVDVISLGVPSLIIVDNPNDPLNPISDPATIVNFPPTYAGVPTSLIFDIHAITFDNVLTLPIERPDITGEFTALNTNFPSPRGITSAESPFQLEVQFNAPKAKGAYTGTISVQTGDFTRFPVIFKLSATVINSPPEEVYLDNNHVPENNVANVTIGNLITKDRDDVDTHTYALISGIGDKDNAYFTIVGNRLVFNTSTDFETLDHYEIRVRSIDNEGASVETPLIVHVMNQAEPPTVSPAVAEIPENSPVATPVFTVVAQDPDNTPLTFGIVEGNDGDAFAINSSGQITVNNSASLDFEEHPIFELTIQVTDPDGLQ
ncbi:MAG: cadherin domain-containing protein, partial [Bacteroidota bacterium]